MKITYSAIRFPPARGGVEKYVETMADIMSETHAVRVITSDYSQHLFGSRGFLSAEQTEDQDRRFEVRRFRHRALPGLRAYPLSVSAARAIATGDQDVIHAHCYYYSSCDAAAVASVMRRTPFVVSPSLPPRQTAQWRLHRRLMRWMFRWATTTTVLSRFERDALIRAGFTPKRLVIVPPVVERGSAHRSNGKDLLMLPWDETVRLLLCVGRVSYTKGIDTLLRALPDIIRKEPATRLVIAGPAVLPDTDHFKLLVREQHLGPYVHFTGDVTNAVLNALYENAEIVTFPSRYEAFGIVAIEAMAHATPVVVSDAGSLPEVVGWGQRGLIHRVGDSGALAKAVLSILENETLASALRAAGVEHVRANHSRRHQFELLEEIYEHARTKPVRPRSRS